MKNNEVGPVLNEFEPVVLNKVDAKPESFDIVQEGFRRVMQEPGGTAYGSFKSAAYKPAGKTGTAQAFYDGPDRKKFPMDELPPEVMNLSLVAYAPSENPEIAMAVMVPWAYEGNQGHHANNDIGRRVLDTYFELKKKRMEGNMNPADRKSVV